MLMLNVYYIALILPKQLKLKLNLNLVNVTMSSSVWQIIYVLRYKNMIKMPPLYQIASALGANVNLKTLSLIYSVKKENSKRMLICAETNYFLKSLTKPITQFKKLLNPKAMI